MTGRNQEPLRGEAGAAIQTDLKFVFVHGLCGWGSYSPLDRMIPYWGFFGGNVVNYLSGLGYDCCCASVDPFGSAWDRACELYAQLAGKTVDYGAEHSARAGHPRFGRDFSKEPLMRDFETSKIVLIGHSFGGATVRLFSELMINGSREEQAASPDDLSDFFRGGHRDRIFAVVALAAPTNGTTAYDLYDDVTFDLRAVKIPEELGICPGKPELPRLPDFLRMPALSRADWDCAGYDMHIDNALRLNSRISTFDSVYYLSYPCASTVLSPAGKTVPDVRRTSRLFMLTSYYMCVYSGTTKGGIRIGEAWQKNDGLVNEISARAPFGAPAMDYEPGMRPEKGVWYVMPTIAGDHMYLMGGGTNTHTGVIDVKPFFTSLLGRVAALEQE